jgi:hypothetical protein
MRRAREEEAEPPEVVNEFENLDVRAAYVVTFGPRCAGWLVRRFRKNIKRTGGFSVHIKASEDDPPWFQIARDFLKQRTTKWGLVRWTSHGERRYRFFWIGGRKRPTFIQPLGVS